MNDEVAPKKTTDEDWEMSEPNKNLPPNEMLVQPIEDWSMTGKLVPPKQGAASDWKMPEPKFQATSGTLPQNFVEEIEYSKTAETQPLDAKQIPQHSAFTEPPTEFIEENPPQHSAITEENPPQSFAPAAAQMPPAAPVLPVEAQPDITDAFSPAPSIETEKPVAEKPRSKAVRIFLAVLGISAMLFFAVAFLVVVYFLFFWRTAAE